MSSNTGYYGGGYGTASGIIALVMVCYSGGFLFGYIPCGGSCCMLMIHWMIYVFTWPVALPIMICCMCARARVGVV